MTDVMQDEADVIVVGTGAGGATAARVLAAAGLSVVMLEEGPDLRERNRPTGLLDSFRESLRDIGTATTFGRVPIPILQGRCVGGSTAINSGIIWRMPDDVRTQWATEFGLTRLTDARELDRVFSTIESELGIRETSDDVLGDNSAKMRQAAEALGLPGRKTHRNTPRCKGAARCLQGCPNGARQSMDTSYVPRAIRDGARLHADCRVGRVIVQAGRAVGVSGDKLDATGRAVGTFRVMARRAVILAASPTQTPLLLARTGLSRQIGEGFRAHPGAAIVGRFDDKIDMTFGATQGYEVPMRARGFKLESLSLGPEMIAARLPGTGEAWQARLAAIDHHAQWAAQVRMRAVGTVRTSFFGRRPRVTFGPTERDCETMRDALTLLVRMMFAAGAREVYPGVGSWPEVLTSADEIAPLLERKLEASDVKLIMSHVFGGACAGSDPSRSVVGPELETHEVRDLFVMDASAFPTNLGVNPQHSIMAVVWLAAEALANRSRSSSAA